MCCELITLIGIDVPLATVLLPQWLLLLGFVQPGWEYQSHITGS